MEGLGLLAMIAVSLAFSSAFVFILKRFVRAIIREELKK